MANIASDYASSSVNPMASAVTTASGAIGAGISAWANAREARKQREWNEEMMQKQNDWSLEMWNRTNEYNSPVEQVQRLRDAGLNPLYYGLDGSSANAFESAQPLGYERAQFGAEQNPVTGALNAKLMLAQEKGALSSARRNESEADLASAKAITESLLRDRTYDLMGVQIDLTKANEHLSTEQARKYGAEILAVEKQVEKMDADIIEAYNRIDVSQRSIKLQEDTFEFEKYLNESKLSLQEKQIAIDWYNANTQRLIGDADIALKDEQRYFVGLQGDKVVAETKTENATRQGKVTAQGIENLKSAREYKYMPVRTAVDVVKGVATATGAIMLGSNVGKGNGIKASWKGASLYDQDGRPIASTSYEYRP